MKILVLVSRDWTHPQATGGDQCTCDYARYLARQGHDITLIAARYRGAQPSAWLDGVRVVRPAGLPLLALHAAAHYLRRRDQFDLVIEEAMASLRLPFLAPLYARGKVLSVWYQVNREIFLEQYSRPLASILSLGERLVFRTHRNAHNIALTHDRARDLVAEGLPAERMAIVPPLMLDAYARPPVESGREQMILWLGKIRRYKCAHHAVEAMPAVLEQAPNARLIIAGRRDDEAYERELLETAARLGVERHLELRLDISDEDKMSLLSQARALAVTSPVEGFSIVIVEANRCGTPVVATKGVPMDTARDGFNALRVPFRNGMALSSAVSALLTDDGLFDMMSRNAKDLAREFDPARTGRWLEDAVASASGTPIEPLQAAA